HLVTQAQLNSYVSALQQQVSRDLQSTWGLTATLSIAATPPSTSWVLGIFNTADQADALGYHDVTPKGLPLGKVFAQTTKDDGASISVVLSHELLEMLVDPWINVFVNDAQDASKFWIREACDACEDDSDSYKINGILVSDFVLPSYFEPDLHIGGP